MKGVNIITLKKYVIDNFKKGDVIYIYERFLDILGNQRGETVLFIGSFEEFRRRSISCYLYGDDDFYYPDEVIDDFVVEPDLFLPRKNIVIKTILLN